jgi:pimeloyl-ACP methyl ester carboxylesterase
MSPAAPIWLYLHGFASGPESSKGRALAAHYAATGVQLRRLDLRVPSLEHLRLSAMLVAVKQALGGPRDRAVIFGSSLGGLAACRVAEEDARVGALVLMAPAFRIAERWRARVGEKAWEDWKSTGWLSIEDHVTGKRARVDFGFSEDAAAVDDKGGGWPDVRVPTLIVHGVRDDVVSIERSREWARGKRFVRLIEVDDGHELVTSLDTIKREADHFLASWLGRSSD